MYDAHFSWERHSEKKKLICLSKKHIMECSVWAGIHLLGKYHLRAGSISTPWQGNLSLLLNLWLAVIFAAQSLIGCDMCCSFSDWLGNLLLWLDAKFCVHSLIGWEIFCSFSDWLGNLLLNLWLAAKFCVHSLIGWGICCSISD